MHTASVHDHEAVKTIKDCNRELEKKSQVASFIPASKVRHLLDQDTATAFPAVEEALRKRYKRNLDSLRAQRTYQRRAQMSGLQSWVVWILSWVTLGWIEY